MKLGTTLLSAALAGAAILALPVSATFHPQDKPETKADTKETRMQGHVVRIYSDSKTMDIRGGTAARSEDTRKIAYDDSTMWTNMGKAGNKEDVKEGSFVIVLGHMQKDGSLLATRIDLRKPR
jgi:hypothetical protein